MSALIALIRIVPSWCYWILLLLALCLGCEMHGAGRIQKKWDTQVKQQATATEAALELRREQNRAIGAEQALASAKNQKAHDDEIAKVRADLRNSERLRLGAAWCDGATPGSAEAGSASISNGADTGGRLVREDLDRDLKALMDKVETALGAGRSAQKFIRDNGMAPQQ
ncbi:hypothetical protein ACIPEN_05820 [Herbaspirillum chlorophenolicum]|uniref:Bacteriophage lysis protein n=1 Tax=Herbaspirillum chlorophenolicum TaxID=211589 RepID=A0ABW8EV50_9BURK